MQKLKTHKDLIVRNIIWGNLNTVLRYALAFVATSFIAKSFSPDVFGTYQLVIGYLAIFESFFLVSPTHLRNYLAANPDKERTVASLWFWQNILVFIVVALICLVGIAISEERSFWVLLFIASIRFVFRFNDHVVIVCDQRLLNHMAQQIAIFQNMTLSLLRIAAAALKTNIYVLCLTSPIQGLLAVIYQHRIAKKVDIQFSTKLEIPEFINIFRGGLFISILSFAAVFQSRIVSLVLAEYLSKEDFGNFQLVVKLVEPAAALGMIIIGANYSVLANSIQENSKLFNLRFAKIGVLTLAISVAMALIIYLTPVQLLVSFFGAQYLSGLSLLKIASLIVISSTIIWIDQNYDFLKQNYVFALCKYVAMLLLYVLAIFYFNTSTTIETGLWITILVPLFVSGPSLIYRAFIYDRAI